MIEARGRNGAVHLLRMLPGEDVRLTLEHWIERSGIKAGLVIGAVGSLRPAVIRFAGRAEGTRLDEDLELCSLSGTLAINGAHLHLVVSDPLGRTLGGHLLEGSLVRTTVEMAVQEVDGITLERSPVPNTGHFELFPA